MAPGTDRAKRFGWPVCQVGLSPEELLSGGEDPMDEVSKPASPPGGRLKSLEGTTYLVTEDVPKLIENWCEEMGKPSPNKQFFDDLMKSLCKALQDHCFPETSGIKVVDLPRESFAEILDRKRSSDAKRLNEF